MYQTCWTTIWSLVKTLGKSHGTSVPTAPKVNPVIAPMITSDFNSILAYIKKFALGSFKVMNKVFIRFYYREKEDL